MMAGNEKNTAKCVMCGREISTGNTWVMPEKLGGGLVPYCSVCQEKVCKHVASILGYKLAMFFCAVMFNMPYLPELFNEAKTYSAGRGPWLGYISAIRQHGYDMKGGRTHEFKDGVFEFKKAFTEYATLPVDDEMLDDEDYQKGLTNMVKVWGYGPEDALYTASDYAELNKIYSAMTAGRVFISEQAELVINNICKWTLERDKCMERKEFDDAKKIDSMIEKAKESEQLRKKDELPQDRIRIDNIVEACERAGLQLYDYEELKKELATYMFHTPYGYTRDAADQMLLLIRNATAWNEGREEVASLPPEFAVVDALGEFADEADELEKKVYKELQLAPLNMDRKEKA